MEECWPRPRLGRPACQPRDRRPEESGLEFLPIREDGEAFVGELEEGMKEVGVLEGSNPRWSSKSRGIPKSTTNDGVWGWELIATTMGSYSNPNPRRVHRIKYSSSTPLPTLASSKESDFALWRCSCIVVDPLCKDCNSVFNCWIHDLKREPNLTSSGFVYNLC